MTPEDLILTLVSLKKLIFPEPELLAVFAPVCNENNVLRYSEHANPLKRYHSVLYMFLDNFLKAYKEIYIYSVRSGKKDHNGIILHPLLCNPIDDVASKWKMLGCHAAFFNVFESSSAFWMTENTLSSVYNLLKQTVCTETMQHNSTLSRTHKPTQSLFKCHHCEYIECPYDDLHTKDLVNIQEEITIHNHGVLSNTFANITTDAEMVELLTLLFSDVDELINQFFIPFFSCLVATYPSNDPLSRYWKFFHTMQFFMCLHLGNVASCSKYNELIMKEEIWKQMDLYENIIKVCKSFTKFIKSCSSLGSLYTLFKTEQTMMTT